MSIKPIFNYEFFTKNRRQLQSIYTESLPIVITANGLLQRSGDTTFPYQQDSNFWYLTGISEPDILLGMDERGEFLVVPIRSGSRETFDGAVDMAELTKVSGITTILDEQAGWERIGTAIRMHQKVATVLASPAYIEHYGMYANPARRRLINRLNKLSDNLEITDLRETLAKMRSIKQPEELQAIQKAIDVTIAGLQEVVSPGQLQKYVYEYEIEADLSRTFRRSGASGHAFAPIVASGKRACTLHNVDNNGKLEKNELIVLDVGAEVAHYAADITRTVSNGKPSDRQQAVYDAVLDVQSYATGLLRPGITLKDFEHQVEVYMGEKLQALGLIDSLEREQIRKYYPHAASHFMGLDVHDVGDYTWPLQPGMVVTCEPGIYIPKEGIGVRIEDDVLIMEDGNKVLSHKLPKKLTLI